MSGKGGTKDLGPHFSRTDKGYRGVPEALLPVYDPRHSLHRSADPARYAVDNPRIVELADSISETGFLIQPGVARKNGTWDVCPVCQSKSECPIVELIAGNRRHRALTLENTRREPPLRPIEYILTLRALNDRDALQVMLGENNAREGNSLLASIRQGVMLSQGDASPEQIKRCFPGKSSKALPIVKVMAECEPPIWEAFAEGKIKLRQAEAISKHSRAAQADALAKTLALPKPEPVQKPPKLTGEDRGALGRLLRLLPVHLSAQQMETLIAAAGFDEDQVATLLAKLPAEVARPEAQAPAKKKQTKVVNGAGEART
jgi:hypothetical protein